MFHRIVCLVFPPHGPYFVWLYFSFQWRWVVNHTMKPIGHFISSEDFSGRHGYKPETLFVKPWVPVSVLENVSIVTTRPQRTNCQTYPPSKPKSSLGHLDINMRCVPCILQSVADRLTCMPLLQLPWRQCGLGMGTERPSPDRITSKFQPLLMLVRGSWERYPLAEPWLTYLG